MPIPVLKLNLAPNPTLWRQHHRVLGWVALGAGALALATSVALSALAYRDANLAGRNAVLSTDAAQKVIQQRMAIQDRLRAIDVEKELPVWRLAERILSERSLPWSRLTAELERSLVQDVRLRSIQRTRDSGQAVQLKLTGEAKTRDAEVTFIDALHQNPFFGDLTLTREADRQGGGVDFECSLAVAEAPPPFQPLPKYGPDRKAVTVPATPQPRPLKTAPRQAVPVPAPAQAIPPQAPSPQNIPFQGPSKFGPRSSPRSAPMPMEVPEPEEADP